MVSAIWGRRAQMVTVLPASAKTLARVVPQEPAPMTAMCSGVWWFVVCGTVVSLVVCEVLRFGGGVGERFLLKISLVVFGGWGGCGGGFGVGSGWGFGGGRFTVRGSSLLCSA